MVKKVQPVVEFKQKLIAVLAMKKNGIANIYARVKTLVQVFEDAEFRESIGGDDYSLADCLDKYVDDCALSFLELRAVMAAFPEKSDWSGGSLRDLYTKAVAKDEASVTSYEKPIRKTLDRPTVKEYRDLLEKLQISETRSVQTIETVGELKAEIRLLRSEQARLLGRIAELEAICEGYSSEENAGTSRMAMA